MNIEFETKNILRSGFSLSQKVKLIQKFSNFSEEDIINSIKTKFENDKDKFSKIYGELIRRNNNHGK